MFWGDLRGQPNQQLASDAGTHTRHTAFGRLKLATRRQGQTAGGVCVQILRGEKVEKIEKIEKIEKVEKVEKVENGRSQNQAKTDKAFSKEHRI